MDQLFDLQNNSVPSGTTTTLCDNVNKGFL